MSFASKLTGTLDIVIDTPTQDANGAPVADWGDIVHAAVPCREEDRYPKLDGDQNIIWDQPVVGQAHAIFVLGLYPDIRSGNGYGVVDDAGTFLRITNCWRFRAIGNMPDHCVLICEEVGS